MHSRIFQISTSPIEKDDYIGEEEYYEGWFVGSIADYVSDTDEPESDYEWLGSLPGLEIDVKGKTMKVVSKEEFFKRKYASFKEHLQNLEKVTLAEFCTYSADAEMYCAKAAYSDRYGFYVDDGSLKTLDDFMRSDTVKEGDIFYLGGVVDYHC